MGAMMGDTFGQVLQSLRTAAGISLAALAERTHYSKALLCHVETGRRRATPELATAADDALGTTPLLATVLDLDGEDPPMKRRALLTTITAATGVAGIAGAAAVADLIRTGLLEAVDEPEDWDAVVADYARQLASNPTPEVGSALLVQLARVRHKLVAVGATPDRLRAAALLGQLYGLWRGNEADWATAHGWYRTAALLAQRSGDVDSEAYVRARTASRALFEGYTVAEVTAEAERALALTSGPTAGTLEAHSALLHIHALTGDLAAGRQALGRMWDVADRLPAGGDAAAVRAVAFGNYLECRIGPSVAADMAWREAEPVLRATPSWWREGQIYYATSLVRHGDVTDGVTYALQAVRALPTPVHTVALAVSDLLRVVPAGYRSAELDELRGYASATPGPWVMLGA